MSDHKIRSGYRVVGESSLGHVEYWCFPTQEDADNFAKYLCEQTGKEVDVLKYTGSWRRSRPPVEFVPSTEKQKDELRDSENRTV